MSEERNSHEICLMSFCSAMAPLVDSGVANHPIFVRHGVFLQRLPSSIPTQYMPGQRSFGEGTREIFDAPFFLPFCTFLTRVAITAPKRPKRTKPGPKAARVLRNQSVADFVLRFRRLAHQHVRCGAHVREAIFSMAPNRYIWEPNRYVPVSRPKKCPWGAKLYLLPAAFYGQPLGANKA